MNAAVARFQKAFDAQDVDAIMAAMTPDCVFEDTSPPDGTRHTETSAVRAAWEFLFAVPGSASWSAGATREVTGTSAVSTSSPSATGWSPRSSPT